MTKEQRGSFVKKLQKGRNDEIYFIHEFLGLPTHRGQETWSKNSNRPINILPPGNKWGKTTFIACRHIWKNFYKIGAVGDPKDIAKAEYQTLVISPVGGQAGRTQQYVSQILKSSFSWVDPFTGKMVVNNCKIGWFFAGVEMRGDKACVKFSNGTRVDIRSIGDDRGSKLQGTDWYYISYDEFTRSYHLEEELDANIMPRLVLYNGDLDLIGTPDMDSPSLQHVHDLIEEATHNPDKYYYQSGSMFENMFFPEENKNKLIESVRDKEKVKQIIEGQIVISGGRMFPAESISNMFLKNIDWFPEEDFQDIINEQYLHNIPEEKRIWDLTGHVWKLPPKEGDYMVGSYLISLDWHLSEGGDETVIYVIRYDVFPYELCYYLGTRRGNPYIKHDKVRNLHTIYNNASLVIDSQGVGKQLMYDLEDLQPTCFDWTSIGKEKKTMLTILKNFLSFRQKGELVGKYRCPYLKDLSQQLSVYKEDDKKLRQDHVMTLGVASWWIENQGEIINLIDDKRY